jgi:hypothetical protein
MKLDPIMQAKLAGFKADLLLDEKAAAHRQAVDADHAAKEARKSAEIARREARLVRDRIRKEAVAQTLAAQGITLG